MDDEDQLLKSTKLAYRNMKARCKYPNHPDYASYGGRGITVCDRWLKGQLYFLLDMGIKPHEDLSLDRIDNNKGYSPNNCRWATKEQQQANRRPYTKSEAQELKELQRDLSLILEKVETLELKAEKLTEDKERLLECVNKVKEGVNL